MGSKSTHVAVFAGAGMGLVLPSLFLARRLVTHDRHLHVTFFAITTDVSQSRLLTSTPTPANLHITILPPPDLSAVLPPNARVDTRMCLTIRESLPSLRSAISALSPPPTVLIVGLFSTGAFDIADEFNMSKYLYYTAAADALAFMMHLPVLDGEIQGQYVDQSEPIKVPGCRPVEIEDLVSIVHDRLNDGYKLFLQQVKALPLADGILVNTSEVIDATALKALRTEKAFVDIKAPKVYPIGPLTRPPEDEKVPWLDAQPDGSVLYVSFGSGGTLSQEQTTALAEGLEKSGQRFLWVSRPPPVGRDDPAAAYLVHGKENDDPATYLPEGFLQRTRHTGLVVPAWAPQVSVLSHPAVAAFLTHGGWSSTLESVVSGKPMIVWPLFAEQGMNATKLEEEIGVGRRVRRRGRKEVVVGEEVEKAVRMMMVGEEGKEMKRRVMEVREKLMLALEEGGSSYNSLAEVVDKWKKRL